jgi:hypothetical protein
MSKNPNLKPDDDNEPDSGRDGVKGGDVPVIAKHRKEAKRDRDEVLAASERQQTINIRAEVYKQACVEAAEDGLDSYDFSHDFDVSEVGADGAAAIRKALTDADFVVTQLSAGLFRITWPEPQKD